MRLEDVVRQYDSASRHYDRFMDVVFGRLLDVERLRERVIASIGDVDGGTVVDVGCGTGRNLPLLVQRVGERGRVVGIDCSEGMLEQARRRVEQHGWRNVELVRGDAVTLEQIREPVDAVVSVWCYGTVYDLDAALIRGIDVLRPGGRIAIMTFTRAGPERGPLRWLYPFYRFAVRCAGIDPANDFDNAALEAKWRRGRNVLRARLAEMQEESYLHGTGLIIAGRKASGPASLARTFVASRSVEDAPSGECSGGRLEEGAAVP